MRKFPLLLCAALTVLPACAPTRERRSDVTVTPPATAPTATTPSAADWVPADTTPPAPAVSPAPSPVITVTKVPDTKSTQVPADTAKPPRGDVSMKMSSAFKLDMPFDTAAQLKLPAKVDGDFTIDVKSKLVSSTPDRSTYTCDYKITLREVGGTRVLGTWSGTLNGEEDGVPTEVVDRAFKRFSTGTEILRRVVAP